MPILHLYNYMYIGSKIRSLYYMFCTDTKYVQILWVKHIVGPPRYKLSLWLPDGALSCTPMVLYFRRNFLLLYLCGIFQFSKSLCKIVQGKVTQATKLLKHPLESANLQIFNFVARITPHLLHIFSSSSSGYYYVLLD